MNRQRLRRGKSLSVEQLEARHLLAAGPRITEYMARNDSTFADADGDFSDWIEIRNEAGGVVNLDGWYLTDDESDLKKWQFSDQPLNSGEYLVVFASGKDRTTGDETHTNFRLSSGGEYLALVEPDGTTVASEILGDVVTHRVDVSFGESIALSDISKLVSATSTADYVVPTGPQAAEWRNLEFETTAEWSAGVASLGYQTSEPVDRAANVLLVANVDGGASSVAGNQSVVDRLTEHFGYEVTVADDDTVSASQANDMDLVIISSSVSPVKIGDTFRDVPVPVFQWESAITDEMELSDAGGLAIFKTSISILPEAVGHPLSAGLDAGTHTIRSENSILHTASYNNAAPGMTWIAEAPGGKPAIGVIDKGGVLRSGEHAADIRIMSYFGDESLVAATDAGLALFDAAIHYALDGRLAGPEFTEHFSDDLAATMAGANSSIQVRVPFESSQAVEVLQLNVKYDDGFVAYLNGTEIARRNAPESIRWDSTALTEQSNVAAVQFEQIDVSQHIGLLRDGTNVLAVQGLNTSASDGDFLLVPELIAAGKKTLEPRYYADPTPGRENGTGALGFVADTRFSVDRGFYEEPIEVAITTATPNAVIRFTTDGSSPSETNGQVYETPLIVDTTTNLRAVAFKDDYLPTNVDTHTYVFVRDVIRQPAEIEGFPLGGSTWAGGSAYVPQDSAMDPAIVDDPAYATDLTDGLAEIPTISITSNLDDIFGSTGWYDGENVEKAVSVEVLYPSDPNQNEQANAGIESHSHDRLKRSLRLNFRTQYGDSSFDTDLFRTAPLHGDSAVDEVDRIVLRAGNNRSWARVWNPDKTAYTIDQFYRDTQIAMSGYGMRGNYAHLYINGVYWGLYNPVERADRFFTADYFGGDEDDWFVTNHGGGLSGDSTRWNYLRRDLTDLDMSVATNYEELKQYVDVEGLVDYLAVSWWTAVSDWPQNNWYGGNRNDSTTDGPTPFRFFAWDGEWSWGQGGQSSPDGRSHVHGDFRNPGPSCPNGCPSKPLVGIWQAVRENDEFMMMFADRVYGHLNNDGALTEGNAIDRWTTLTEYVRNAVVGESARWGDSLESAGDPTRTRDVDWQREVDRIVGLMTGNNDHFINALRAEGYYPNVDAPTFSQHGGQVPTDFELTLTNPNDGGQIFYTIDGTDPRLPGDLISAAAILYDEPIQFTDSTQVRTRVFGGTEWSALNEATFVVDADSPFVISEIHYNPVAPSEVEATAIRNVTAGSFEFVEVLNTNSTASASLAGLQLVDGVEFAFGVETLEPGESAVVVRDVDAFRLRYGHLPRVLGEWTGSLSNGGETLAMADATGNTLLRIRYDDSDLWPQSADGVGASIELVDPRNTATEQMSQPMSWRGSVDFGGSPGANGSAPVGVVINEVLAHTDAPVIVSDSIELWNASDAAVDLSGWYLSDSAANLRKFEIPSGTTIGAGEYLVFDESDFNPNPESPGENAFALSGTRGDDVWLVIPNEFGGVGQIVDDVHFGATRNGVSLGRLDQGMRADRVVPLSRASLGCENVHWMPSSIVLSEVHYAPSEPSAEAVAIDPDLDSRDLEFVELYNATLDSMDMSGWRIRGGIGFDFAASAIGPGESIVVTRFNPESEENASRVAAFRAHYGLDASTTLIGGYSGTLENNGERITLLRPDESPADDPTLVPHTVEDEVIYDAFPPWPAAEGSALARKSPTALGNSPATWDAIAATPGSVQFNPGVDGDLNGDGVVSASDIDLLNDVLNRNPAGDTSLQTFDLDQSGRVDANDRTHLVEMATLLGDINFDGRVDAQDLNRLGRNWQRTGGCLTWAEGDLNGDRLVDALDLNLVGQNWLSTSNLQRTPQAAVADGLAREAPTEIVLPAASDPMTLVESHQDSDEVSTLSRWRRQTTRRRTDSPRIKTDRTTIDSFQSLDDVWSSWE